jgi:hypothetical protein
VHGFHDFLKQTITHTSPNKTTILLKVVVEKAPQSPISDGGLGNVVTEAESNDDAKIILPLKFYPTVVCHDSLQILVLLLSLLLFYKVLFCSE